MAQLTLAQGMSQAASGRLSTLLIGDQTRHTSMARLVQMNECGDDYVIAAGGVVAPSPAAVSQPTDQPGYSL
jgi:hypothetical protein